MGGKWSDEAKARRREWHEQSPPRVGRGPRKIPRIAKTCSVCDKEFLVLPFGKDSERRTCGSKCLGKDPVYLSRLKKGCTLGWQKNKKVRKKYHPETPEYKRYARRVRLLTEETYNLHRDTLNPQGHPRTLCGVDGGWQLDHIVSIKKCFNAGLPPEEAAALSNLQMLPWKDNLEKRTFEPYKGNDGSSV